MQGEGNTDPAEVRRFQELAAAWWDPRGPLAPLHKMNPVRLAYIRERTCRHFAIDQSLMRPFTGLSILDVGCGAGLLSEPLARLGAAVTAIDPAGEGLLVARHRASEMGLEIDYREAALEDLDAGRRFDLVAALEVVEHVPDPGAFLGACVRRVRPGGALVLSTLNRTARSFALGIVAAEYVLGWLPRGTHTWRRFLKPSEVGRPLRRAGARVEDVSGMVYDPLRDRFRLSDDVSVNYMLFAAVGPRRDEPGDPSRRSLP